MLDVNIMLLIDSALKHSVQYKPFAVTVITVKAFSPIQKGNELLVG
jgi:hypothetical protein